MLHDRFMKVVGVEHVQLAIPAGAEAEARAFYSGLLGIPEVPKPAALADNGGAWFDNGPVKIHVGVDPDFRPAKKAHPALIVEDLEALLIRLQRAGVTIKRDSKLPGYSRAFVSDPFGNRVELMEPRTSDGA
jgi:catechol 2,3-dioxygenase-like lactoylglutathione lyase family enzyme